MKAIKDKVKRFLITSVVIIRSKDKSMSNQRNGLHIEIKDKQIFRNNEMTTNSSKIIISRSLKKNHFDIHVYFNN